MAPHTVSQYEVDSNPRSEPDHTRVICNVVTVTLGKLALELVILSRRLCSEVEKGIHR